MGVGPEGVGLNSRGCGGPGPGEGAGVGVGPAVGTAGLGVGVGTMGGGDDDPGVGVAPDGVAGAGVGSDGGGVCPGGGGGVARHSVWMGEQISAHWQPAGGVLVGAVSASVLKASTDSSLSFGGGGGVGGGGGAAGQLKPRGTALVSVVRSVLKLMAGAETADRLAVYRARVWAVPGARPSWFKLTVELFWPMPPRSITRLPSTKSQASSAPLKLMLAPA